MTVNVLAHFVARADRAEQLATLLTGLIAPTRAEAGCRMYTLWRNREDPRRFTMVETWDSDAALDTHLATPHVQNAVTKLDELLDEPLRLERCSNCGG
ncbi:MAG: antibiotic biosynthesis monooxygenase [Phycisphaerales bacterium]|nr:antibiotic biosynthesis monooxygenase [Phycisphaerales bacterium]